MNPKPTWKVIAKRAIPHQMQRAQNMSSPKMQLTPTQLIFRDTLINNLPPGIGLNATINQTITYLTLPNPPKPIPKRKQQLDKQRHRHNRRTQPTPSHHLLAPTTHRNQHPQPTPPPQNQQSRPKLAPRTQQNHHSSPRTLQANLKLET